MSASSVRNEPGRERRRTPLVARRAPATSPPPPSPPRGPAPPPPPPAEPPGLRDTDGEWMAQREAAEAAGVSMGAIRRWRKAGTIAERHAPGKQGIEVFLTADRRQEPAGGTDDSASTGSTASSNGSNGPASELGVLVPLEIHQRSLAELILRLTDTTERAVRAEARVEILEAQLADLGRSTGRSAGTLPPPPRPRKG